MANYNGSLEAVDCDIHSVRYDMVLERSADIAEVGFIRSPTTLWHHRYNKKELEPRKRCFYTIMANYNGSLEAVDCDIHDVRYDGCQDSVPHYLLVSYLLVCFFSSQVESEFTST
eukprot:scaffold13077_cov73-Skeletonema_dohrnii-CCMP3373.AAC.1